MEALKRIRQHSKAIKMIKEYIIPLEEAGFKGSVVANSFLTIEAKNHGEVIAIVSMFKPSGKLFELTFAGRDPIITKSPFSIHVNNYSHCEVETAVIKYQSESLPIWIKIPIDTFPTIKTEVTKLCQRGGGMTTIVDGYNVSVSLGKVQAYAGGTDKYGSRVTYANTDEDAKRLNDIFNGGR